MASCVSRAWGAGIRAGLLSQPVLVHGRQALPGVIGARPPHVLPPDQQRKVRPMDELFIDLGRPPAEVADLVRVGDVVTMARATTPLAGSRWSGKAMDNRASLVAIAVALAELATLRHAWDVLAVATVQEEIGLKGAATAAFGLQPTVAIAIDVGFAKQPGAGELPYELDKGPLVAYGPNIHPRVFEALTATADALEMGYQTQPMPGPTGTDAGAIQVAGAGVPCGLVGIPLRYMHSTVETLSLRDVTRVGRLLAHFVARLDEAFVAELVEDAGDWDPVQVEGRGMNYELLIRLSEAAGVSGNEKPVRRLLAAAVKDRVDGLTSDTMGNLLARLGPVRRPAGGGLPGDGGGPYGRGGPHGHRRRRRRLLAVPVGGWHRSTGAGEPAGGGRCRRACRASSA